MILNRTPEPESHMRDGVRFDPVFPAGAVPMVAKPL